MGSLVDKGVATLCYCWVVERKDGVTIGVTDHDRDVTVENVKCSSTTGMTTTKVTRSLGLDEDDMTVDGAIDSVEITEDDLDNGLFDNATVIVYLVNWQDPSVFKIVANGYFGNVVKQDGGAFSVDFRSLMTVLSQSEGRTHQRRCDANLGDNRCGVDITDPLFSKETTVVTSSGAELTVASVSGYDDGWFSNGTIILADGTQHKIRTQRGSRVDLWAQPSVPIGATTSVTLVAGCDKRAETCSARFRNILNFQGFHLMPGQDKVTSYPIASESGTYDSESLFER